MSTSFVLGGVAALLMVGAVMLALVARVPLGPNRPGIALVELADTLGLDVKGLSAAGRVGRQFVQLELGRSPVGLGYHQRRRLTLRVDGPPIPGLSLRGRRPTDLIGSVRLDDGRFDQHVWVIAVSPAEAIARLTAQARAASLRAIEAGAEHKDGRWTLTTVVEPRECAKLVKWMLAASTALEAEGSLAERLTANAHNDPVLEVRVANVAERIKLGDLNPTEVKALAAVLLEGMAATPPVKGAADAMDHLRAQRSAHEVGRVSVAPVAGGEVAIADGPQGEVSLAEPDETS